MERLIYAKTIEGLTVKVRQTSAFSDIFVDEKGFEYNVILLDFTQPDAELPDIMQELNARNKEWHEQSKAQQAQISALLQSMDANAIADHKAKIDEREYWRRLRGDIFLAIGGQSTEFVDRIVRELYDQDKEFFKDK